MVTAMGQFHVTGRLTGPAGQTQTVELLVDTGATPLALPRTVAAELGLVTLRTQSVVLAGGDEEVWPCAGRIRRRAHRDAGDARTCLARNPRS